MDAVYICQTVEPLSAPLCKHAFKKINKVHFKLNIFIHQGGRTPERYFVVGIFETEFTIAS